MTRVIDLAGSPVDLVNAEPAHEALVRWLVDRFAVGGLGLPGSDHPWRDRGVEHAATTLAWGLAGTVDARYPLFPPPDCDELAARYELLTGRAPLTECGENGWSP